MSGSTVYLFPSFGHGTFHDYAILRHLFGKIPFLMLQPFFGRHMFGLFVESKSKSFTVATAI